MDKTTKEIASRLRKINWTQARECRSSSISHQQFGKARENKWCLNFGKPLKGFKNECEVAFLPPRRRCRVAMLSLLSSACPLPRRRCHEASAAAPGKASMAALEKASVAAPEKASMAAPGKASMAALEKAPAAAPGKASAAAPEKAPAAAPSVLPSAGQTPCSNGRTRHGPLPRPRRAPPTRSLSRVLRRRLRNPPDQPSASRRGAPAALQSRHGRRWRGARHPRGPPQPLGAGETGGGRRLCRDDAASPNCGKLFVPPASSPRPTRLALRSSTAPWCNRERDSERKRLEHDAA